MRPGSYRQGGFEYRLRESAVAPGGWRLDHDERGGFAGMDFEPRLATTADFVAMHRQQSTAPDSGFVRWATVQRRHRAGVDILRGCTLTSVTSAERTSRETATAGEWFGVLADLFGLTLDDVPDTERAALWTRVRTSHDAWLTTQRNHDYVTEPI